MRTESVILVDDFDHKVGEMEKIEAHRKGLLHRAVSVFIVNKDGEWLLQQRALSKYHSGGLWSNSCCTHPYVDEPTIEAARRRLKEEMGIEAKLVKLFDFSYYAALDHELIEHELDHLFVGFSDQFPNPDPEEVMKTKYASAESILLDIEQRPYHYTEWFKTIAHRVYNEVEALKESQIATASAK